MTRLVFYSVFACVVPWLSGCALRSPGGPDPTPPPPEPGKTSIEWLGHNAFAVTSSIGFTVVIDPFDPVRLNYPAPRGLNAGAILVSSEDPLVSNIDLVENTAPMLRGPGAVGVNVINGVRIVGVAIAGDRPNTAYSWRLDGIRFAHLGKIERPLTLAEASRLKPVDVLFLPVGEPPTLRTAELDAIVEALAPSIVVPMAYRTPATAGYELRPLSDWLGRQTNVRRLPGSRILLSRNDLPAERLVLVPKAP